MDRKLKLKVGQKVVVKIEEMSNAARNLGLEGMTLDNIDKWCVNGEVTKIGRKYITVKFNKWNEEQFSIEDDYRQKYTLGGANYKLYLNKEEIINDFKANKIYVSIQYYFSSYKNSRFTLDQLKRIKEIIDENKED